MGIVASQNIMNEISGHEFPASQLHLDMHVGKAKHSELQ